MATELAKAYVQIVPSAQGISGSISQAIDGEAASAGKSAGTSMATSLGASFKKILVGLGIGKVIKDALTEGADLQQSLGGVETLFKESADKVKEYANEAYKTAGLSANSYMENVTSFAASLLQGLGGDTKQAAEIANMAIIDMSDNANKMGTDMINIQNAYQGFAKQNYTMLDNLKLGYGGTKKEMERLLEDAEKLTGIHYDIENFSDIINAIHVIQGELDITGTTAKEASETFTGSLAAMAASFKNLLGTIVVGTKEEINMAFLGFVDSANTFLFDNLLPMLKNVLVQLPEMILDGILQMEYAIQSHIPDLVRDGVEIMKAFIEGIGGTLPDIILVAGQIMMEFVDELLNVDWLALGQEIIEYIATSLEMAAEDNGIGIETIQKFLDHFKERYPEIIEAGAELIISLVNGIMDHLPEIIDTALTIMNSLLDTLLSVLPEILEAGAKVLLTLVEGIISKLPDIIDSAQKTQQKFIDTIIEHLPEILEVGIKIIAELVAGIIRSLPSIIESALQLGTSFFDTIFHIDWIGLGINIIKGLIQGIVGAAGELINAVKDMASSAFDAIKDFFHIGSPSKLMQDEIGKQIDAGMAIGIEANADSVVKAMDDIANETFDIAQMSIATTSGATQTASSGSVFYNEFHIDGYNKDPKELAEEISYYLDLQKFQAKAFA